VDINSSNNCYFSAKDENAVNEVRTMEITFLWDTMPCSLVGRYQCFDEHTVSTFGVKSLKPFEDNGHFVCLETMQDTL
jgi:hypothetical protein